MEAWELIGILQQRLDSKAVPVLVSLPDGDIVPLERVHVEVRSRSGENDTVVLIPDMSVPTDT